MARTPKIKVVRLKTTLEQIRARVEPGRTYPQGIVPLGPKRGRRAPRRPGRPARAGGEDQFFPPNAGAHTHVTFHGGGVASTAPVQLIFWGSRWNRASTSPSAVEVHDAAAKLLSGAFMSDLVQYGVGRSPLRTSVMVIAPDPPPSPLLTPDGDIIGLVVDVLRANELPDPVSPDRPIICAVVLPPNATEEHAVTDNAAGAHFWGAIPDRPVDPDALTWVAWVGNGDLDRIMRTLGHEIVETCTNPNGDGWMDDSAGPDDVDEIGDICNASTADIGFGFLVESYWSQEEHKCVIPTRFSLRRLFRHRLDFSINRSLRTTVPQRTHVRGKIDWVLDVSTRF
jgi:hypothetical protein